MTYCEYCGTQIVRADARFCPNCGKPLTVSSTALSVQIPAVPPQIPMPVPQPAPSEFDVRAILFPKERVAWELDFKEGVLHRHVTKSYLITNARVLAVDVSNHRVVISLPIRDTDLVVMNRHFSSEGVGGGVYHGGVYSGTRSSSSRSMGTLVFLTGGIERIKLGGVGDPEGVKNLFTVIKRESLQNEGR